MDVPSFEFDILIEKNARKKYTCPMCKEILVFAVKTNCNHRFCKYCISKWLMHFDDCPACGQQIQSTAPHPRTDKWIQQLFDLATVEFREDRAMCVNYRKLQQVKLELTRGDEMKQTQRLNKDVLLEEFNMDKMRSKKAGSTKTKYSKSPASTNKIMNNKNLLKASEPLSSSSNNVDNTNINTDNNNNNNSASNSCKLNEYNQDNNKENDVPSLFGKREPNISIALLTKNLFSLESTPTHPSQIIRFGGDETSYGSGSNDVTSLFGVGGIDIHNHSSTDFRQLLSHSSPDLIRVKDDDDVDGGLKETTIGQEDEEPNERKMEMNEKMKDEKSSINSKLNYSDRARGDGNENTVNADDIFPPFVNSARTFSLHFPEGKETETEGPKSRIFTLAELTCHDELVFVGDNDEEEEDKKGSSKNPISNNNIGDGDRISDGRLTLTDNLDGAKTSQMNLLKAESMRARIQHEICMASLPSLSPARHSTHSFSGKQSGGECMSTMTTTTPTNGSTTSQREKQDLQTCREALLNLRLRLLPPAKKSPTGSGSVSTIPSGPLKELNKRINSDAQIHLKSSSFSSTSVPKGKLKHLP